MTYRNLVPLSLLLTSVLLAPHSQAATTYICQVDGKAAFSTIKVNNTCQTSSMDGISTEVAPDKLAELTPDGTHPNSNDDTVNKKSKEILSSYDDVVILPKAADMVTNSAMPPKRPNVSQTVAAPKLEIKLRNQAANTKQASVANNKAPTKAPIKTAAPIRTAAPAIVYAPPPKPQLTRKQVLQREISNEHAALRSTKAQLEAVRKKGGNTATLQQAVRDREANIRAIQGEMNRI